MIFDQVTSNQEQLALFSLNYFLTGGRQADGPELSRVLSREGKV